ncbi:hypothetical protein Ancab_010149 [Ancistrocladus abbreviatus]
MGRGWYNWAPKSSQKSSGRRGGRDGGGSGAVRGGQSDSFPPPAAAGCISILLHLFDFSHFQFCLDQPHAFKPTPFIPEEPASLKGNSLLLLLFPEQRVEAPRNSLEAEEMAMSTASLTSITEGQEQEEDSFNDINPHLGLQINTRRRDTKLRALASSAKGDHLSSESSSSPGPITPNLVARLMGLDLLPAEGCSTPNNVTPRSSLSSSSYQLQQHQSKQQTHPSGIRSLPETPRVLSSARKSDVDHHSHRLSLQIINKENRMTDELELSRHSCSALGTERREWKLELDENKSPSHYARQIIKQVKETVLSRRFGMEITNTKERDEFRRDEHLLSLKAKTAQKEPLRIVTESNPSKNAMQSRSPRLQALKSKGKATVAAATKDPYHQRPSSLPLPPSSSPSQSQLPLPVQKQQCSSRSNRIGCKNNDDGNQRFSSRVKRMPHQEVHSIRNKKDEVFVRQTAGASRASHSSGNKCRKTRMSSELLPASVPSIVVPLKKSEDKSLFPAISQKQAEASEAQPPKKVTQLSSYSNCTASTTARITTTSGQAEFLYVTRILKRTGIDRATPVSFITWFSPSHPLNPSIFDDLEYFYYSANTSCAIVDTSLEQLSLPCNRKLLFDLVDEMLVDILKPNHKNFKIWDGQQIYGHQLVKLLCTRIGSFPSANCQVLQEIDAVVERDLPKLEQESRVTIQEESEAIVMAIERDILDSLVQDMTIFTNVSY